jgi:hypothetical protein
MDPRITIPGGTEGEGRSGEEGGGSREEGKGEDKIVEEGGGEEQGEGEDKGGAEQPGDRPRGEEGEGRALGIFLRVPSRCQG